MVHSALQFSLTVEIDQDWKLEDTMPRRTQAVVLLPFICIFLHLGFKHDSFNTMEETVHGHNIIYFKNLPVIIPIHIKVHVLCKLEYLHSVDIFVLVIQYYYLQFYLTDISLTAYSLLHTTLEFFYNKLSQLENFLLPLPLAVVF